MEPKKLSYYITKSRSLNNKNFEKKIRVALLSSFTINGIEETLMVKAAEKNIFCTTYLAGYNQYNQEILDEKSNLYQFNPDITFLILDTRSLLGDFFYSPYLLSVLQRKEFITKKFDELINLIKIFTTKSKSKLVMTNFAIPAYSSYGIFETKTDYGLKKMVNDLNNRLSDIIRNLNSVYLFDFNSFILQHGENNVFDFKQYFFGDIKIALDYIPNLSHELMGYILAILGITKRCIVLDLDNTLWGGVVGEDGFDGIKLGPSPPGNAYVEFQRYLLALYNQGILLAINSKNNPDDALKVIEEHPHMILRKRNFACMKINWNDKVSNMQEISNELNFGLDNMVFIDDDPVNREYMKVSLPQVLTVDLPNDPSLFSKSLIEMNDFNVLKITEEDAKRGEMYIQQQKRREFEQSTTNIEDFLKSLDLRIKIEKANEFTIPRISQLTLKTNQFNLTTKRYQEEEIRKFSKDEKVLIGCAQVQDKFGDNGITGVYIVKKDSPEEWIIDTFLLSCRVMGREIEKGILGHILKKARESGVKRIKAKFIPTKKNKPIENFLPNCGFKQDGEYWIQSADEAFKIPDFLTIDEK